MSDNTNETTIHTDGGYAATVDSETLAGCRDEIFDALANGADYDEISDIVADALGLEPDYIMDILGL